MNLEENVFMGGKEVVILKSRKKSALLMGVVDSQLPSCTCSEH
jgi:hypothetical protein